MAINCREGLYASVGVPVVCGADFISCGAPRVDCSGVPELRVDLQSCVQCLGYGDTSAHPTTQHTRGSACVFVVVQPKYKRHGVYDVYKQQVMTLHNAVY